LRGSGLDGARMASSGLVRRSRRLTAHDNAERSTAHRPHTTAADAPCRRHRPNAASTTAGVTAANPMPPSGSLTRSRATEVFDDRVAGRQWSFPARNRPRSSATPRRAPAQNNAPRSKPNRSTSSRRCAPATSASPRTVKDRCTDRPVTSSFPTRPGSPTSPADAPASSPNHGAPAGGHPASGSSLSAPAPSRRTQSTRQTRSILASGP
jgi:hypothetical protein